jgi:hypothetical protein
MKIIQSFAKYDEGVPQFRKNQKKDYFYLNFYSFILSYITLKEQHGSVIMFCNQSAYDSIIKYIPYDEVIIKENDNSFIMWSKYKLDCIREVNDDLIHVDSDVIIFDKIFKPFIEEDYDIIVQNILTCDINVVSQFGFIQKEFLNKTNILTKPYDGKCFSCGTLGLKKNIRDYYYTAIDILYDAILELGLEKTGDPPMLLEEQLLYYIAKENDFKTYEIIPNHMVKTPTDIISNGNKLGYLHLWYKLKFKKNIIQIIRKKMFYDYPEYLDYVIKYEQDVMVGKKIFEHVVLEKLNN